MRKPTSPSSPEEGSPIGYPRRSLRCRVFHPATPHSIRSTPHSTHSLTTYPLNTYSTYSLNSYSLYLLNLNSYLLYSLNHYLNYSNLLNQNLRYLNLSNLLNQRE